ncbi:MAG: DUF5689 domain-containing protein [Longimicrobiales bacterium]
MAERKQRMAGGWGVLALAALAVTACDPDPAPPFEIEGTGGVEGFLFYDADQDGSFSALAGDYEVVGADVVIFERGTQQAFSGASATTDGSGLFTVTGLPAGTHDLMIDTTTIPSEVAFCQNPVPVTVYLGEVPRYDVAGRAGCIITIAEAEQLDPTAGEYVTVSGIVTSYPGQVDNSFTWIEDSSGGIQIYSSALEGRTPPIEIGDRIEVSGTVSEFADQLQIAGAVTLNAHEEDVLAPVPTSTTTAEVAAAGPDPTDPLQGKLVTLTGVEVTAAFGSGSLNEQNAHIDDGSGQTILRVDDGVADRGQLNTLFPVGSCYDITGVVGSFGGDGQVFPRSTDDVVEVACN